MNDRLVRTEELRQRLLAAQQLCRTRGSTVVDELRGLGLSADEISRVVELSGGLVVNDVGTVSTVLRRLEARYSAHPSIQHVCATDGRQLLLMADPWDEEEVSRAVKTLGVFVEPAAASGTVLRSLGLSELSQSRTQGATPSGTASPRSIGATGGAVDFVNRAIKAAYRDGASDVHFECDRVGVTVKLRLDGVMSPFARLDGQREAEEVISRIKVLAQLDITERRLPQDGRFRFESETDGVSLDLRVSIMPSVFGEDAVLRLLDKSHLRAADHQVTLDALGFAADGAKRIRLLANLPNGMLLVTGPTGSGKTTSVYAALSEINTGREKIITIEDPVEYELPGVLQIPVNERKGLTFAKGLRSILRHDPDRILVGEIRDAETAEIAVQSSLTGHLVFTTVHANSLFDVIGRFRHFDIDMFGFVSSLNGVVVQRLMRRLCPVCCGTRAPNDDERAWLDRHGRQQLEVLPAAVGCKQCHQTGYRGRFVIAEVHLLDDRFRDLIMRQAEVSELKQAAFSTGVRHLVQQALDRVGESQTSLEELFRVVGQI